MVHLLGRVLTMRRMSVLAVGLLLLSSISASPAQAGFPGCNGWLAFDNSATGATLDSEIWVTRQAGSSWESRRLTADPGDNRARDFYAAVHPNGKEVAFASTRNTEAFPNASGDSEIYVMDIADDDGDGYGDNLRRLTDNTAIDYQPAWSPGGQNIAFSSNRLNPSAVEATETLIMDADGSGEPIALPHDPALTTVQHPVFTPDGQWVVFAAADVRAIPLTADVYMTRSDGSGSPIRLTIDGSGETHPEVSPDGTRVVFLSNRLGGPNPLLNDSDLFVMKLEPEGPTNVPLAITDGMVDAQTGIQTNERIPAWSPDGESIAFWAGLGNAQTPAQRPGIWLIAADGSGEPVLITDPTVTPAPVRPDWGPAPQTPAKNVVAC